MNENHSEIDRLKKANRRLSILSTSLAIALTISTFAAYYILNAKNNEYKNYRAYVQSTNQRINEIQDKTIQLEKHINAINSQSAR